MNQFSIRMPKEIRYMSQASDYLRTRLPQSGKYILDKTLTGCGGTEFFINSGRPLVLISPRSGVLINKSQQHPECHLFRGATKTGIQTLKNNLRDYLNRPIDIWLANNPAVILVTLDSAKYVIEELKYRGTIDNFLFLCDEFQCLISDAAFKGDVDLEFLKMLDAEAKNICYMSATPIDNRYLQALPEFQNVDYYRLDWDPHVIVEPTVRTIMMKNEEGVVSILGSIIANFRRDGYFACKIINGQSVYAKEAVIFVNEVKTIYQIITNNNLKPSEVTILISASSKYVSEFEKKGFMVEKQSVNSANPMNTTFTFCSKASFEGRDFYSLSAFTYIFIDGTKDWEIHDTSIEIPQMLGRQRLDANPFKYNAVIYYRVQPKVLSQAEYMRVISDKLKASQSLVDIYNNADDITKRSLVNIVKGQDPNNRYRTNYLDVVNHTDSSYSLDINYLVAAAEHNLSVNKTCFYSNPLLLTTSISNQMATYNGKAQELRDFERNFNDADSFSEKMRIYSLFRSGRSEYQEALYSNPFIELCFHEYFRLLGPHQLSLLNYDEEKIRSIIVHQRIVSECKLIFIPGEQYDLRYVKQQLQVIYDKLGLNRIAKAKELSLYLPIRNVQPSLPDGSRPRMLQVL